MNHTKTTPALISSCDVLAEISEQANSLQETGRRLCRSRASLYEMAGRGEIKFHKIGRRTVVMESEILRILREAPLADIRTKS